MSEPIQAWECIGCGRIEAPQTCIGVCQDRRVALVYASEHEEAERALARSRREHVALATLARALAFSHPRAAEWEQSYRALQARARTVLAELAIDDATNESRAKA